MRILLRADAGEQRGTGHVMRCLTLSEGLTARGHEVALMGAIDGVGWLSEQLRQWGRRVIPTGRDELDRAAIESLGFDRVVIDSYWIDPDRINALDRVIPTLAIIDNDARGIHAGLFLDQNLGAENREWPDGVRRRLLAGSRYALVRDTILAHRGSSAAVMGDRPRVVAFMGGTDPGNVMTSVAGSIARDAPEVDLVAITTSTQIDAVRAATSTMPSAVVSPPTTELPSLLGSADLVVSAAGTSAWDVCAMGKPAVLVAVVDNQVDSLAHAVAHGVALGLDGTLPDAAWEAGAMLAQLINDDRLREELTARSLRTFDGMGKHRVSEALEAMT